MEWGSPCAEPVVLLHGFCDHCRTWDFCVTELCRIRPETWIVAPDCRGHGDSGWVGAGGYYHFFDYLLDLDALFHHLGVPSIKLVGHSMGGTIACLYAGTYPARVSRLGLVEGLGPPGIGFADVPPRVVRWLEGIRRLKEGGGPEYARSEEGARRLKRTNPRLDDAQARHLAHHAMRRTGTGSWRWKFDPLHRTTSPQPFYLEQFRAFLARVSCPTLVVEGAESNHPARAHLAARSRFLENASLATIPNAGHWVHLDNPAALAQAMTNFFEEKTGPQTTNHRPEE